MLYIYRRKNSTGARDLAEGIMVGLEGLRGIPARRTKGVALRTLTAQDQVICWGDHFAAAPGTRTLNNVAPLGKYEEAKKLAEAGVPTVTVSKQRPAARGGVRPPFVPNTFEIAARRLAAADIDEVIAQLNQHKLSEQARLARHNAQPIAPAETWLARKSNHVGGSDLLNALAVGDYYSKKENIVEEYRIHMFKNKSIRAGKKVARPNAPNGGATHQWIRNFDAGWIISYEGFNSTKEMRKLARKALTALGLQFGAVDIGKKADGTLIVLEVNRAPGVEGGTVEAYAKHIINWVKNPVQYEEEED